MNTTRKLPNIWGQGAIFAYSGFEGECSYYKSLCGTLMGDCLGIRFRNLAHASDGACLVVKPSNVFNIEYTAVLSDTILSTVSRNGGGSYPLDILFVDQRTILLRSDPACRAELFLDYPASESEAGGVRVYDGAGNRFAIAKEVQGEEMRVALAYGEGCEEAARAALRASPDKIIRERLAFYEALPVPRFRDEAEEMLYFKCASILRSTVYTPEGKIRGCALTPDRFPHRAVWLWDTAYLIIGIKHLSHSVARDGVLAILDCAHEDGFLPHMTTPDWQSEVTQPPVLAWAVLELYRKSGDIEFLQKTYDRLASYILWDIAHRDKNGNGLPEWVVGKNPLCRCGESGMDNTPRFDEAEEMDCIDFAAFLASDMRCMAEISRILGKRDAAAEWQARYDTIRERINTVLWDEETGFYYDRRLSDGKLHPVKSVAAFLPLFAGIPDERRARLLLEHLADPAEFGTPFPIPTVSADDKTFPTKDMFRGTVWLNFNYLIARGLDDYGFRDEAEALREKTVSTLKKWYQNDGVLYEFYDSMDEVSPSRLARKGHALFPYMPELRYVSVRDFSWGASAVMDFMLARKDETI